MVLPWLMCRYVNHTAEVSSTNSSRSLNCFRIFFTGKRSILTQTSSGSRPVDSQNGSEMWSFGRCCVLFLAVVTGYLSRSQRRHLEQPVSKQTTLTTAVKRISFPRIHGATTTSNSSHPQIWVQLLLWQSLFMNAARFVTFPMNSVACKQASPLEFPGGWGQQGKGCRAAKCS